MRKASLLLSLLLTATALAQSNVAYRVGTGIQLVPTATTPSHAPGSGTIKIDSTNSNALTYVKPDGTSSVIGSGGGGYLTIKDEGSSLTARTVLNFTGAGVTCTDNAGASRTDCSIPGTINDLPTIYAAGSSQSNVTVGYNSTVLGYRFWDNATPIPGNLFEIASSGGTTKYFTSTTEGVALQSAAYTSGSHAPILKISTTSHTGLAAGTPLQLFFVGGIGSTHQYTGGAWANYLAEAEIQTISTISATSATSISDYYTLKLTGAAAPGTNMTLTNRWVLGTTGGPVLFDRDFAGPTNVGVLVQSRATASLGTQQPSPGLQISGNGWDTGASASRQADFSIVTNPVQGNPLTATLDIYSQINAGGWSSSLFSLSAAKLTMSVPIYGSLGSTTIAPSWTSVTYQNSYVDYGLGGYAGSAYYKDANGIVHVRVAAKSGTATAAIFTLPAGYRPGGTRVVTAAVDGTFHNVTVSTAGVVQTDVGGNTFALCFIDFPAEN